MAEENYSTQRLDHLSEGYLVFGRMCENCQNVNIRSR